MSTPHTPGPWELIHDRSNKQYAIVTHNDAGPIQMVIAKTDNHSKATSIERQGANARLIAAAPAMLDALAYVVNWHREHDSGEGELFGLDYVTTCLSALRQADPDWHTTTLDWGEYLTDQGLDPSDAPYTPIMQEWEQYPIVQCIRLWERLTGQTYSHPASGRERAR
jgi:hypothetical protein